MTLINPDGELSVQRLRSCFKVDADQPLRIDLRGCTFVRPSGAVLLGIIIEHAHRHRVPTHLWCTPNSAVSRYLERMQLQPILNRCGVMGDRLTAVQHHDPMERFVELTRFDTSDDIVAEDLATAIVSKAQGWDVLASSPSRLYNLVFELAANVEQHSHASGLVALQHYPRKRTLEMAFGDFGVGIEASLASAAITYAEPADAVIDAVLTYKTCTGELIRGRGLPALHEQVVKRWLGELTVMTSNVRVSFNRSGLSRGRVRDCPPGTLVVARIPTK